jgi:hypothetical protein
MTSVLEWLWLIPAIAAIVIIAWFIIDQPICFRYEEKKDKRRKRR